MVDTLEEIASYDWHLDTLPTHHVDPSGVMRREDDADDPARAAAR